MTTLTKCSYLVPQRIEYAAIRIVCEQMGCECRFLSFNYSFQNVLLIYRGREHRTFYDRPDPLWEILRYFRHEIRKLKAERRNHEQQECAA